MQTGDLQLIELTGSARQRGQQHGAQCATEIRALRSIWEEHVGFSGQDRREYMGRFLAETNYTKGFKTYAPHLLDEIHGIAEGADVAFNEVLELQLLDEEWSFRSRLDRRSSIPHHCTAAALRTSDQTVLVAQNFDGVSWMEGFQRLFLHHDTDSGRRMLIFSLPGMLALNGVNNCSVAVCVNSLVQLDGNRAGLPVMGIIRLILECASYQQARARLHGISSGSGQNYIIGGPDGYGSFEASGFSVTQVGAEHLEDPVGHTNHPLVNGDDVGFRLVFDRLSAESKQKCRANSCSRYEQLMKAMEDTRTHNVSGLQGMFASRLDPAHPLSREKPLNTTDDKVIDYTVASTIYELGTPPLLHMAAGPPSCTPFRTLDLFRDIAKGTAGC
jgi:hypothetical protein